LAVGYGDGETYLGSDALALAPLTQKIAYLDEGDWVVITARRADFYDKANVRSNARHHVAGVTAATGREGQLSPLHAEGDFRAADRRRADALLLHGARSRQTVALPQMDFDLSRAHHDRRVRHGFYAGLVAKYWFETFARVPVDIDVASEFRYRDPGFNPSGLALFISQSGETADTLAALRHMQGRTARRSGRSSTCRPRSMARESRPVAPTLAGPEIGVASTKAFTCQLTVLAALAAHLALGKLSADEEREIVQHLIAAPAASCRRRIDEPEIEEAPCVAPKASDVLYLGRGPIIPLALEGALKLKEISYIHAEGYASGEMKHGPIALIDEAMPVIVLAPMTGRCSKRP
jgi:glucosamine--fructose-6-phosphate aminotransferase (isomerizing)